MLTSAFEADPADSVCRFWRLSISNRIASNTLARKSPKTVDNLAQCCGVSLPTLTKRIGSMAQQSPPASNNLTGESGTVRPESVDVAEAVALMIDLGETAEDEAEETASADEEEDDDATADDGAEEGDCSDV